MASFTNFLKLLKKNPATDGKDTFNIETMLNENWDKIDKKVEENSSAIGQNTQKIAQLSNPNLLINGDFQIWQRGLSFLLSNAYTYTVDRWRVQKSVTASGKVTKHYNSLRVETTSDALILRQYVEGNFLGKVLTLSIKVNGEIMTCTGSVNTAVPVVTKRSDDGIVSAYFIEENGFLVAGVNIYVGVAVIDWIKIELGEIATPLSPRSYGEELALCQRYGILLGTNTSARVTNYSNNVLGFLIPFSTELRNAVSIIGTAKIYNMSVQEQAGFTLSVGGITPSGIFIIATKINHGLTDSFIIFNNGGFLDAEIY